ncbi:hypothetical protein V5O48_012528 [Marasmius crinis-equi]|uniref:F-box domain-containing protein n=1 Tax=Marasmius crinis-equi TaxID=585013 RepID=A0ABR3F2L2_9AGAR
MSMPTRPSQCTIDSLNEDVLTKILLLACGCQPFFQLAQWCSPIYSTPIFLGDVPVNKPGDLSQVCRQWRQLINASPLFWTCIQVELHDLIDESRFEDALVSVLDRSQSAPLHLFLRSHRQTFEPLHLPTTAQNKLIRAFSRAQSIYIDYAYLCHVDFQGRLQIPACVALQIEGAPSDEEPIIGVFRDQLTTVLQAPLLCDVRLDMPQAIHDAGLRTPSHITQFRAIERCRKADIATLLAQTPHLEYLHFIPLPDSFGPPTTVLHLGRVRTFGFEFKAHAGIGSVDILDHFVGPEVADLQLPRNTYSTNGGPAVLSFLNRSNCTIRSLLFPLTVGDSVGEQPLNLLHFFQRMPGLRVLKVELTITPTNSRSFSLLAHALKRTRLTEINVHILNQYMATTYSTSTKQIINDYLKFVELRPEILKAGLRVGRVYRHPPSLRPTSDPRPHARLPPYLEERRVELRDRAGGPNDIWIALSAGI